MPAMARLPVEKMAPRSGVRRVTPQVGQPAPIAIRPVMMPAFSRLAELSLAEICSLDLDDLDDLDDLAFD